MKEPNIGPLIFVAGIVTAAVIGTMFFIVSSASELSTRFEIVRNCDQYGAFTVQDAKFLCTRADGQK